MLIMAHSQRISYANNRKIIDFKVEIDKLRRPNANFLDLQIKQNKMTELQNKLELLSDIKLEGARIRSKVNFVVI